MKMWYGLGRGKVPDYRLAATSVCKSVSKFTKYGLLDGVIWVREGVPVRRIEESMGDYKAHRDSIREAKREKDILETGSSKEPTPDFFGLVWDLVAAHSVFSVSHPEHEADDVISSLSDHFIKNGCKVTVLSKDTDFLQLPQEIEIWNRPSRPSDSSRLLLPPEGILRGEMYLDYKSLLGDPSDNIPGVRGIGKKTAQKIVTEGIDGWLSATSEENRKTFLSAKSMIKFEEVDPPYELLLADLPDWNETRNLFAAIDSTLGKSYNEWALWKNSWSKTIKGHEKVKEMLLQATEKR
jgi:5'-3' exonuclease